MIPLSTYLKEMDMFSKICDKSNEYNIWISRNTNLEYTSKNSRKMIGCGFWVIILAEGFDSKEEVEKLLEDNRVLYNEIRLV